MAWTAGAGSVITFLGSARARGRRRHVQEVHRRHGNRLLSNSSGTCSPWGAHDLLHLADCDHLLQTRKATHRRAAGTEARPGERTGPHEPQGKVRHRHGDRHCGTVHAEIFLADPGFFKDMDRAAIMMVGTRALLPHPHPHRGRPGDHPLEHHPALRRGHVHRLLPL